GMVRPALASISASLSAKPQPRLSAMSPPMVDLPAPERPTRKILRAVMRDTCENRYWEAPWLAASQVARREAPQVAVVIGTGLRERVATELFEPGIGE